MCIDLGVGTLRFARNGIPLGEAFRGVTGPLVAVVTLASEESKVTIQNRPTVLNTGEYTGGASTSFDGADGVRRPGSFDTRFIGNAVLGWRPNAKWEVSGKVRVATGLDAADIAFMTIFGRGEHVEQSFNITRTS